MSSHFSRFLCIFLIFAGLFRTPGSVSVFFVLGVDIFILHVPYQNSLVQFVYLVSCILKYDFIRKISLPCYAATAKPIATDAPCRNDPSRENDISAIHGAAHAEPFPIVPFHFCTKKPPKNPQIFQRLPLIMLSALHSSR